MQILFGQFRKKYLSPTVTFDTVLLLGGRSITCLISFLATIYEPKNVRAIRVFILVFSDVRKWVCVYIIILYNYSLLFLGLLLLLLKQDIINLGPYNEKCWLYYFLGLKSLLRQTMVLYAECWIFEIIIFHKNSVQFWQSGIAIHKHFFQTHKVDKREVKKKYIPNLYQEIHIKLCCSDKYVSAKGAIQFWIDVKIYCFEFMQIMKQF